MYTNSTASMRPSYLMETMREASRRMQEMKAKQPFDCVVVSEEIYPELLESLGQPERIDLFSPTSFYGVPLEVLPRIDANRRFYELAEQGKKPIWICRNAKGEIEGRQWNLEAVRAEVAKRLGGSVFDGFSFSGATNKPFRFGSF